jgi:hypothetical protein
LWFGRIHPAEAKRLVAPFRLKLVVWAGFILPNHRIHPADFRLKLVVWGRIHPAQTTSQSLSHSPHFDQKQPSETELLASRNPCALLKSKGFPQQNCHHL